MKTKEVKSFSEVDISELRQPSVCVYRHPEALNEIGERMSGGGKKARKWK